MRRRKFGGRQGRRNNRIEVYLYWDPDLHRLGAIEQIGAWTFIVAAVRMGIGRAGFAVKRVRIREIGGKIIAGPGFTAGKAGITHFL